MYIIIRYHEQSNRIKSNRRANEIERDSSFVLFAMNISKCVHVCLCTHAGVCIVYVRSSTQETKRKYFSITPDVKRTA